MADSFFKIGKGISLVPQSGTPSNGTNGDIYYDSALSKFRKFEAGSWSDLSGGSAGPTNIVAAVTAWNSTITGNGSYAFSGDANTYVTITTTGGPVMITLEGGSIQSRVTSSPGQGAIPSLSMGIARNGSNQGTSIQTISALFAGGSPLGYSYIQINASAYNFIDRGVVGVPGTYTYYLRINPGPSAAYTGIVSQVRLVATEL